MRLSSESTQLYGPKGSGSGQLGLGLNGSSEKALVVLVFSTVTECGDFDSACYIHHFTVP